MAKLNKEAVGQYNYLVADDAIKRSPAPAPSHSNLPYDVSVELVARHPRHVQLIKLEPPKLFETAYHSDFRPPPKENLVGRKTAQPKRYRSQSSRTKLKSAPAVEQMSTGPSKADIIKETMERKNRALRSLLEKSKATETRAKTADPTVARYTEKPQNDQNKTADFQRAIVQGRSEWKHVEPKSYDILNPEKPNQLRETNPYGAKLENMQETVAQKYMDDDGSSMRTGSSMSILSDRLFIDSRPHTQQSGRTTRRTANALSEKGCNTDINAFEQLETIQEEDDGIAVVNSKVVGRDSRKSNFSIYGPTVLPNVGKGKAAPPIRQPGKVKAKKVNLFERKVPDKRFYKPHRMRQTPNEMNRYKKMRNRTFFKPLEQAVHEKDFVDHEVKYQPERQLLMDARAHIRQDLKNVRTKNINSLVDRFAQRAELKKEEKRGRLGLPTYAGREPVSIYKLNDTIPENNKPRTDIQVQLPVRRRITPSIGSVQRARNLSTYANVWNQPCAPPYWGPQKVDHGLYLPPMAVNS